MDLTQVLVVAVAVIVTVWGGLMWWVWRRQMTRDADRVIVLLSAILAALRPDDEA